VPDDKKESVTYSPEFQERLLETLRERKARAACEVCLENNWTVLDRPIAVLISKPGSGLSLGPHIPSAGLVCNNCGNIRMFALGALGLFEPKESGK
jgi:hypothetical protein